MNLRIAALRKTCGDGTSGSRLVDGLREHGFKCKDDQVAKALIWTIVQGLLERGEYLDAGLLLWGRELFNPEPLATQRVFKAIRNHAKVILLGAAGQSKSFSSVVYLFLDWLRDPQHTEEKFISTTAGHARANTFSTLHYLHENTIVPMPGVRQDGFIGLDPKNLHSAITQLSIPQGSDGKGALQGFHPMPRRELHPLFGRSSRVRASLDEAEEVPVGVWDGVANLLGSRQGDETIKVVCATNPRDVTSRLAQLAEPAQGWGRLNPDSDHEWTSKEGWRVIRLDGADSENVKSRTVVHPGFLTFEGYEDLRLEGGGDSAKYWIFGRGMYPMFGAADNLIPLAYLDGARGDLVFDSTVTPVGGVDLAFEGDDVTLAAGRFGRCVGYRAPDAKVMTPFEKPRWCVQLDQVFVLAKYRTQKQYEQIRFYCEQLGIAPEWLVMDRTGNGTGVYDLSVDFWNKTIRGIHWGSSATESKILSEDRDKPNEICKTIETEMHWSIRKWCEFGYFWISPRMDASRLFNDLSGRKVRVVGKGPTGKPLMALEPKREFKKRNGKSPDFGDACVMMLHIARINGSEKASFHGTNKKRLEPVDTLREIDRMEQYSFSEDA